MVRKKNRDFSESFCYCTGGDTKFKQYHMNNFNYWAKLNQHRKTR